MDIKALDTALFFMINKGSINPLFDIIMPFLSNKGYLLALPFGAYMLWQASRQPLETRRDTVILAAWTIAVAVITFLLADWIGNEIKHMVRRIRPCNALEGVRLLGGCSSSFSMPSNHSINSFGYAFPLFFMTRSYLPRIARFYPLILAISVAYSRPYLGVHYPSDVIMGAILAAVIAFIVMPLFYKARETYKTGPEETTLAVVLAGFFIFRIYFIMRGLVDLSPLETWYWQIAKGMQPADAMAGITAPLLAGMGTAVFGDTAAGVRIAAVLLSLFSGLIIYRLVVLMYQDKRAGVWAAVIINLLPATALAGITMLPESITICLWLLSMLFLWKGLHGSGDEKEQRLSWLAAGVAAGIMPWASIGAFMAAAFIYIAMTDRKLLKRLRPYVMVLAAGLAAGFSYAWGINSGHAAAGHISSALPAVITSSITDTLYSIALTHIVLITPLMLGLVFYSLHKLFYGDKGRESKFLFAFSIPVLVISITASIYTGSICFAGYLSGIIAVAIYFAGQRHGRHESNKRYLFRKSVAIISIAAACFIMAVLHFPQMIKLQQESDPTLRLRSWAELGRAVRIEQEHLLRLGPAALMADSCDIATELAFYVPGKPATLCGDPLQKLASGSNALFVSDEHSAAAGNIAKAFANTERKSVRLYHRGREVRAYSLLICYNFRGPESGPTKR